MPKEHPFFQEGFSELHRPPEEPEGWSYLNEFAKNYMLIEIIVGIYFLNCDWKTF